MNPFKISDETLELTKLYISSLTKDNDKTFYELDSLIDICLDYYSRTKNCLRGDNYKNVINPGGGIFSSKYHHCFFEDDEIDNISIFLSNLCIKDLAIKNLIVLDNAEGVSDLFLKYNKAIRLQIVKLALQKRDDELKR